MVGIHKKMSCKVFFYMQILNDKIGDKALEPLDRI